MATENPRVWFKSITLENVRSFGTKQTINFTDKDGNAARWNVILGDNGTGKTTVLKGLFLTVDAKFGGNKLAYNNDNLISLVRWREDYKVRIDAIIEQKINTIETSNKISFASADFKDALHFLANNKMTVLPITHSGDEPINKYSNDDKRLYLYAYGASRRISNSAITIERESRYSLFYEDVPLINAEEWVVQADYISLKNTSMRFRYEKVIYILKKLLQSEVTDIYISTETGVPKVFFKTPYGDVRLHELSLGYKTLIAWIVDFANGLFDDYSGSEDPLAEPAVCLVDEIDLHLHPKFQRNIIQFLTDTFSNTQFIVTAHSPLIVLAAEDHPLDANIILLKRNGNHTVVVNDPVDVSKWSVDQILNSDLFGHVPARSESLTELRVERDKLLSKQRLTKKDSTRLTELDEKIGFVPFGQDQAEIQAETIIQQLADVLRKQQQVQ